ncbi:hypothetical protein [Nocardia sp. NPDC052566]|uniref:hypothetical protein n=1 Tax=Nocardia sp. NPDC052566 TaxID=3364330 RepID=UPI0037C9A130
MKVVRTTAAIVVWVLAAIVAVDIGHAMLKRVTLAAIARRHPDGGWDSSSGDCARCGTANSQL